LKDTSKFVDGIQAAMTRAEFNWDKALADFKEQAQRANTEIKANIIVEGIEEARTLLRSLGQDVPRIDLTQDLGQQFRDTQIQLEELQKTYLINTQRIASGNKTVAASLQAVTGALEDPQVFMSTWGRFLDNIQAASTAPLAPSPKFDPTQAEIFRQKLLEIQTAIQTQSGSAEGMLRELGTWFTGVGNASQFSKDQLTALHTASKNIVAAMREQQKVTAAAAELEKKRLTPETYSQIAEALANITKASVDGAKAQAENVTRIKEATDASTQNVKNTNESINSSVTSLGTMANAAINVNTQLQGVATQARITAQELANVISRQQAIANSGVVVKQNSGGRLGFFAAGGRGTDTIPAQLSPHEFVVNARSARRFFPQLLAMNAGQTPVYREQGGSVVNVGDINVNMSSTGSAQTDSRELARIIRRDLKRGTIRLN
jgi:hypothetical protein